jgi:hypothetical protein
MPSSIATLLRVGVGVLDRLGKQHPARVPSGTLAELTLRAVMAASAKVLTAPAGATAARAGTAGFARLWLLLPGARQQADAGRTRPEMGEVSW